MSNIVNAASGMQMLTQAPMQMSGALSLLRASQGHIVPGPYFVSTDETGRKSAFARGTVDMVDRNRKIIADAQLIQAVRVIVLREA